MCVGERNMLTFRSLLMFCDLQVKVQIDTAEREYDLGKAAQLKYGTTPSVDLVMVMQARPLSLLRRSRHEPIAHIILNRPCRVCR